MEQATAFCSRMEMARMPCGREGFASQTRLNRSRRRKANPQDSPARSVTPEWGCATPQGEVEDFPR
jgi:hypothetical protein